MLATGGDVVFYGTMDGWFKAVDARTGTELWKFHVASGIVGNPDHLSRAGRQAVRRGLFRHRRLDGRGRVSRRLRRRSVRRARRGRRDEGHQEVHGAREHGLCLRALGTRRRSIVARVVRSRACSADGRALRAPARPPLRVCADPNNMPFSNERGEGFENKIAELVARELHRPLDVLLVAATPRLHPQHAQRRTLRRGDGRAGALRARCSRRAATTDRPTCSCRAAIAICASIRSTIARLKTLTIGIQITGDDYNNPPAAQALAARHLVDNVRGYHGLRRLLASPIRSATIVDAVADGRVDVAVVWGPLAGYFAQREPTPLDVTPVAAERDGAVAAVRVRHRHGRPPRRRGAARRARRDHRAAAPRRSGGSCARYGVPLR